MLSGPKCTGILDLYGWLLNIHDGNMLYVLCQMRNDFSPSGWHKYVQCMRQCSVFCVKCSPYRCWLLLLLLLWLLLLPLFPQIFPPSTQPNISEWNTAIQFQLCSNRYLWYTSIESVNTVFITWCCLFKACFMWLMIVKISSVNHFQSAIISTTLFPFDGIDFRPFFHLV